jgi:hypothetical protein
MLDIWLETALELASSEGDFYTGARKIHRNKLITFPGEAIKDDLEIEDIGFTKTKMTLLRKGYYVEESIKVAQMLWELCLQKRKYRSAGFHCYNHLLKSDPNKKSKRASVMGPCIQSVCLTYLEDHTTAIDCFYRTTEYFKKFAADLIFLRDVLLPEFDFTNAPIREINFHFAGLTCHPMYFITLLPHLDDPVAAIKDLRENDEYFWNWVVKWTARYLVEEHFHGIEKYMQAMRVRKVSLELLTKGQQKKLVKYLRANHPGYKRTSLQEVEEDE